MHGSSRNSNPPFSPDDVYLSSHTCFFLGSSMILRYLVLLLFLAVVYCAHLRTKKVEGIILDGPLALASDEYDAKLSSIVPGSRCGTKHLSEDQMSDIGQKLAEYNLESTGSKFVKPIVDVYFHVVQNKDGDGSVTDEDINNQMKVLNDAYEPVAFRFLLKGITRIENDDWHDLQTNSVEEANMKSALQIQGVTNLNVYVTTTAPGVVGWGSYPSEASKHPLQDGVVIDYRTLPGGSLALYNRGTTLIHQVGHWLGLQHPYQGGCNRYAQEGDGVSDTPATAVPASGCPVVSQSSTPALLLQQLLGQPTTSVVDSCPGQEGQLHGYDLVNNFMDLADDACQAQFTLGQQQRMHQSWRAYRKGR